MLYVASLLFLSILFCDCCYDVWLCRLGVACLVFHLFAEALMVHADFFSSPRETCLLAVRSAWSNALCLVEIATLSAACCLFSVLLWSPRLVHCFVVLESDAFLRPCSHFVLLSAREKRFAAQASGSAAPSAEVRTGLFSVFVVFFFFPNSPKSLDFSCSPGLGLVSLSPPNSRFSRI